MYSDISRGHKCDDFNAFLLKSEPQQTKVSICFPISNTVQYVKGIVHPKMKILSLITRPHVVPNPYDFHSFY